jgi:large subunit ribosomal protein L7/L12
MKHFTLSLILLTFITGLVFAQEAEDVQQDLEPGYAVMLLSYGDKKLSVIKYVRSVRGISLKEAKDLVESAPSFVKGGMTLEDANDMLDQLEALGAQGEIREIE